MAVSSARVLIVESRYYDDIVDHLVQGAVAKLTNEGVGYKRVQVPGALEIPGAIRFAIRSMELRASDARYAGYIALGCVIRGQTSHYDYVCENSIGGIQKLVLEYSLASGTGILTCPNRELALERARVDQQDKGGWAAHACLEMMKLKREMGL